MRTRNTNIEETTNNTCLHTTGTTCILLATIKINVLDRNGDYLVGRVLFDSGSQSNFITSALARKLQLPQNESNISITEIIGGSVNAANKRVTITVQSKQTNYCSELVFNTSQNNGRFTHEDNK